MKLQLKSAITLAIAALSATSALADDVIVMRNGDIIEARVAEITPNEVKYKKASRPDGPLYTVNKADIFVINYEDGEKETFDNYTPQSDSYYTPQSQSYTDDFQGIPQRSSGPSLNASDPSLNEMALARYNVDVQYTAKPKNWESRAYFAQFYFTPESVIADKNLKIDFISGCINKKGEWTENKRKAGYCFNQAVKIRLTNTSDNTLFIDLANTFFRLGSMAIPYYVPTSTTTTQLSGNSVGVNLGAVAGGLGLGRSVSGLASGINLGSSSLSTTTTVFYSQRIISIPPFSTIELDPIRILPTDLATGTYRASPKPFTLFEIGNGVDRSSFERLPNISQTMIFDRAGSPMEIGFFLTYSLTEDLESTATLNSNAYVGKLIGLEDYKPAWVGRYWTGKTTDLTPNWEESFETFLFIH